MFSCEYCEIFKDTYFKEHLRMTAPEHLTIEMRITAKGHINTGNFSNVSFHLQQIPLD